MQPNKHKPELAGQKVFLPKPVLRIAIQAKPADKLQFDMGILLTSILVC